MRKTEAANGMKMAHQMRKRRTTFAFLSAAAAICVGVFAPIARTNALNWEPPRRITVVAGVANCFESCDSGPKDRRKATGNSVAPTGIATDSVGNLYIAERYQVRKVDTEGLITTIAGVGSSGFSGDGGLAVRATFNDIRDVTVDASGNVYIADFMNSRIRKIAPSGIVTTAVGTGVCGYGGDGRVATEGQICSPWGIDVDGAGNLYIADWSTNHIRKVDADGILHTVVGDGTTGAGEPGFSGDDGPAITARLNRPRDVDVDESGNIYIADSGNFRVRKVTINGLITTIAGSGSTGRAGDGGPAAEAQLGDIERVTAGNDGQVFLTETYGGQGRVRRVWSDGLISTVAGNYYQETMKGWPGYKTLLFNFATAYTPGLATDTNGNLYVATTGSPPLVYKLDWRNVELIGPDADAVNSSVPYLARGRVLNPTSAGKAITIKARPSTDLAGDIAVSVRGNQITVSLLAPVRKSRGRITGYKIKMIPKDPTARTVVRSTRARPGEISSVVLSVRSKASYRLIITGVTSQGGKRTWNGPRVASR